MAKILLVNPPLPLEDRYGAFSSIGNVTPPLGLCYLASVLREEGYDVAILDAAVETIGVESCVGRILKEHPDWVGFTSSTAAISVTARIAGEVKRHEPNVKTVVGGPHVSAAPEETMKYFPSFDFGVIGEGEITFPRLLNSFETGDSHENIEGLVLRVNGAIVKTPPREFIKNLDEIPFPAWDLLPDLVKHYSPTLNAYRRWPSTSLVTSRGCPNRCIYCGSFIFGRRFRPHSARYVVGLMRALKERFGMRDIYFHDDAFLLSKSRARDICETLFAERLNMTWACFARIADAKTEDLPMLKQIRRAGCWQISFGIESGSREILHRLGKNITPNRIREAVSVTKKAGIAVNGFFIIGSPGETKDTLRETYNLVRELRLDTVQYSYFTPFPGTEAHEEASSYGKLHDDWSQYTTWHPVFIPKDLDRRAIESFSEMAYRSFYSNPSSLLKLILRTRSRRYLIQLFQGSLLYIRAFVLGRMKKVEAGKGA